METKVCKTCKEEKLISNFTRYDSGNGTGWRADCKECLKNKKNIYREKNKEKLQEKGKLWREKNKEYLKQYREKNKEYFKEKNKKYWAENKEKQKEKVAIWRKENAQYIREYRKANRDRDREQARLWARTEKGNALRRTATHRYRARKKNVEMELTAEQWLQIKRDFSDCCAYCGINNVTLEQEHVIPVSKGGGLTDSNILPSCRSCNATKSNKDFLDWYKTHSQYSAENERYIVEYLNNKGANINYELELK